MYKLILIIITISVMGCRATLQPIATSSTDSVRVETREVVKIIRIPADTVRVSLPIVGVDTAYIPLRTQAQGKRASVTLEISNAGQVTAEAICKELEEQITLLERTVTNFKRTIEIHKQRESWLQQTVRRFKTWLIIAGVVALLLCAAYVATYLKPFTTIFKRIFKA